MLQSANKVAEKHVGVLHCQVEQSAITSALSPESSIR